MTEQKTKQSPIQVRLPYNITETLDKIKLDRVSKCEPTSNKSIVIDALKAYYKKIVETAETAKT